MAKLKFQIDPVYQYGVNLLTAVGLSKSDANIVMDSLVRAELEGASSHGLNRLIIYATRIEEGRINAAPKVMIENNGSFLKVDGDNGLGQVVASKALDQAFTTARDLGMVGVFVKGSNHFGTAAFYCQKACQYNMALIATTNSPPGIAPWGGKKAYFGTNPIAFGFPVRNKPPIIIDMSSSVVARGNIILANQNHQKIPFGWAMDQNGKETDNPEAALDGALFPLGGVKGYALAMAVEVLSGILTGAAFGPYVNNLYKENEKEANVGHSFIVMDISKLGHLEQYFDRIDCLLDEVKESPKAEGITEIYYPGERRSQTYKNSTVNGIILTEEIVNELSMFGLKHGVTFPSPI
ncbi:Ldh family oxidoreductase [Gracilibacillus sp. D59]|uniref:Ldh family oxidoreductase n=1 Tax=Gracilibacillus sp. D59 TaxID=3457434 RepID=UPI003FCE4C03